MINLHKKGAVDSDLMTLIGFFGLLFFLWLAAGGPEKLSEGGSLVEVSNPVNKVEPVISDNNLEIIDPTISPWQNKLRIRTGNAKRAYQPREEYIVIEALRNNKEPINISGFVLENGKGNRLVYVGGNLIRYQSEKVVIPQGMEFFWPKAQQYTGPIILKPGERAIVTTGRMPQVGPYDINVSFKTNICTGYLDRLPSYNFYPGISQKCPKPSSVPVNLAVEQKCLDYINRLNRCHTPVFRDWVLIRGEYERNYVDNVGGLSRTCQDFLRKHYNYEGCVANYLSDDNFYGNEWRIFLNRPFELWAEKNETITLYDTRGLVVTQISY